MRLRLGVLVLAVPMLASVGAAVAPRAALAQATNFRQEWDDIKNALPGMGSDRAPIDFAERPPLVVPPSNDLPPPVDAPPRLGVNDPDSLDRIKALSDPRRPVPAADPGAAASGVNGRKFLIEPPAGMQNPDTIANPAPTTSAGASASHKRRAHTAKAHIRRTPAPADDQATAQ